MRQACFALGSVFLLTACSAVNPLSEFVAESSAPSSQTLTLKMRLNYPEKLATYISGLPLRMDVLAWGTAESPADLEVNAPDSDKNYRAELLDSREVPLDQDFEYRFKLPKMLYLNASLRFYFDGNGNGIYDSGEITCLLPTPEATWDQSRGWELSAPTNLVRRPYTPPNPLNQLSYTLLSPENGMYQNVADSYGYLQKFDLDPGTVGTPAS